MGIGAAALSLFTTACFEPAAQTRGLACTEDSSCGGLECRYGFCGGPPRCESGASVGDYCFEVTGEPIEIGARTTALAIATVDMDPWPDLVVASGDDGRLTVLGNDGTGGVRTIVATTTVGASVTDVGVGAVDDAGLADVVATTGNAVSVHPLLATAGTPAFASAIAVGTGLASPRKPQIGSFVDDAERRSDVAILVDNGFDVLPQTGASTFGGAIHTSVSAPTDLRSLGMAMERVYVAASKTNSIVGHDRKVDGTFSANLEVDVGVAPERFTIADVDRDGFSDLVVVGSDGGVWLTTGKNAAQDDWSIPEKVYSLGWRPSSITAVNLDDDIEPEYVIAGETASGHGDVYLFDNDGDGKPLYGGSLGTDGAVVAVADLDRDGIAELVVGSGETSVVVARRTVAPPPVGIEDSGSSSGGGDPTQPTASSLTSDPSGPNPTMPGTLTDASDTDSLSGSEGGLPPCTDGGFLIGINCYEAEYALPLAADADDLVVADFSGDFLSDLVIAGGDVVLGVTGVGVAKEPAFEVATAGRTEVAVVSLLDVEGFNAPHVVFTDAEGYHVFRGDNPSGVFTFATEGAHSPGRVDLSDEMFSQPALLMASVDGVFAAWTGDEPPGAGSPLVGVVDVAAWVFGGSQVLVADGIDVRQYTVDFDGFVEDGVLPTLGASTQVGITTFGYVGHEGDSLHYIGVHQDSGEPVASTITGFGLVHGGFDGADITGDGIDDILLVRELDFFDEGLQRLLTVVPIGWDGIPEEPINITNGVGVASVDIFDYPPTIYFTALAEEWGDRAVHRIRGAL